MEWGLSWVDILLIPTIIGLNLMLTVFLLRKHLRLLVPEIEGVVSRGMSALGQASGDRGSQKALEKAITGEVLDQYPEVMALLQHFSPETVDMIKKNPGMALSLIERYRPLLEKFLPGLTGKAGAQTQYDL